MKKLNELYKCNSDVVITGVSINSKETKEGDIFVCVHGAKVDRHDFINEAIKNGARALIVAHEVESSVPYIVVDNPDNELVYLSKMIYDYDEDKLHLYGVTGTDGKTSVATIVSTLIGNDKCGYIGTNGRSCAAYHKDTDNTTPAPHQLYYYFKEFLDNGCNSVCMEASSEAMLKGRLDGIKYDVVGMTNITSEHLNSHGSLENYVLCKKEIMTLTKDNGYCVLNHDDDYYQEVRDFCKGKILTYGKDKDNDLQIVSYNLHTDKTEITFKYKDKVYEIVSPLLGDFNIYNLACALLMCLSQGYEFNYLSANIKNINVSGRLDTINEGQDFTVMIDYAHTPNGITSLLRFVRLLKPNRIITVIGQAGERDPYKRKTVGKIVATNSDVAIFCYEDPRSEDPLKIIEMMCEEIKDRDNYEVIVDRSQAIKHAIDIAKTGDIVLVLGKGNETYEKLKDGTIYFNDIEEATKHLKDRLASEASEEVKSGV